MNVFQMEGGEFCCCCCVQLRMTICTLLLPHINYQLFNLAFVSCHLFPHMEVAALPADNRKLLTRFTLTFAQPRAAISYNNLGFSNVAF